MIRTVQWTPGLKLDEMELQIIEVAYAHYQSNKSQTAIGLGISVRNLDLKLDHIKEMRDAETASRKERDERDEAFLRRARGLPPIDAEAEKPIPKIAPREPMPVQESEEIQELLPLKNQGQRRSARQ